MKIQAIPSRPWKKVESNRSTVNHTNGLISTGCSLDFWEMTDFSDMELLQIKKQNTWAEMEYQTVQYEIMHLRLFAGSLSILP